MGAAKRIRKNDTTGTLIIKLAQEYTRPASFHAPTRSFKLPHKPYIGLSRLRCNNVVKPAVYPAIRLLRWLG